MDDGPSPAHTDVDADAGADDALPHPGVPGKMGCLFAIGLALVLGGGSLGLSYYLLRLRASPVLGATNDLARVFAAAEGAQGVQAVRDLGCDHAGAFDVAALRAIAQGLEEGRAAKEKRAAAHVELGDQPTVVKCWMKSANGPTCEDVARTFVASAHPSAGFTVAVENPNGPVCAEAYTTGAVRVGPTPNPNVPSLGE